MAKYVGIDIGASSIKVAVLRTAYRKLFVDALETVDVGTDAAAALKEAYTKAVGSQGFDGVATALPGVLGSIHRLEIPASAQKQLAEHESRASAARRQVAGSLQQRDRLIHASVLLVQAGEDEERILVVEVGDLLRRKLSRDRVGLGLVACVETEPDRIQARGGIAAIGGNRLLASTKLLEQLPRMSSLADMQVGLRSAGEIVQLVLQ